MERYCIGDKIRIRDNITYIDTNIHKDSFAKLYDRTLTVCSIQNIEYGYLIRVKEDNRWSLSDDWIEHIEKEEKEDNRNNTSKPHLITISFENNRVVGNVYANCKLINTVELNYPEYNNNESTASIAHKVLNELFPEEYVFKKDNGIESK